MNGSMVMEWAEELGKMSESGPGVTRLFLSDEHRAVIQWLSNKAKEFNLDYFLDDSGNLVIKKNSRNPGAKTLIFGSHQDTVRHGGKYDGMLGIILPLAAIADLPDLSFNIEIIAFGDEEGTRFNSTLVGSSAVAGNFDESILDRIDDNGLSMRNAMQEFGIQPSNIPKIARNKSEIDGFIEVHIEQGPILEQKELPVGVVTAITGIERHVVTLTGQAGHAGTVPMELRDDALVKAIKIIEFVDVICKTTDKLVGVVGKLDVLPNAANVIPSEVKLTVELRSPSPEVRSHAQKALYSKIESIKGADIECTYSKDGIHCDENLINELSKSVFNCIQQVETLFSGAGHDGLAMAHLTKCGMLFVRCKKGLSHHPDEAISHFDCQTAIDVLRDFLARKEAKLSLN